MFDVAAFAALALLASAANSATYHGSTTAIEEFQIAELDAGSKYRTALTVSGDVGNFGTGIIRYHHRDVFFADTGNFFYSFSSDAYNSEDLLYRKEQSNREFSTYAVPEDYVEYSETHDAPFVVNIFHNYQGWLFLNVSSASGGEVYYTLTVDKVAAIPEPEIWAAMVCGFGLLGSTFRHRKVRRPSKRVTQPSPL